MIRTQYRFNIDCWSCLYWLLPLSILTVDPLYTVHWMLILSTLTVDPLYIDLTLSTLYINCWSSLLWLLILSTFTVDLPPRSTVSIVDLLQVNTVDCWSTLGQHCWSTPPGSILLIVDPPWVDTVDRWSALGRHCQSTPSGSTVLIVDLPWVNTVDCWTAPGRHCRSTPPTDFNFVIFNILIMRQWILPSPCKLCSNSWLNNFMIYRIGPSFSCSIWVNYFNRNYGEE